MIHTRASMDAAGTSTGASTTSTSSTRRTLIRITEWIVLQWKSVRTHHYPGIAMAIEYDGGQGPGMSNHL